MKQRTYLSFILHYKDKRAPILSDLFLRDFYLRVKLKMGAKLVSYQALWVEIQFAKKTNVICWIIYRQHNSPQCLRKLWRG